MMKISLRGEQAADQVSFLSLPNCDVLIGLFKKAAGCWACQLLILLPSCAAGSCLGDGFHLEPKGATFGYITWAIRIALGFNILSIKHY